MHAEVGHPDPPRRDVCFLGEISWPSSARYLAEVRVSPRRGSFSPRRGSFSPRRGKIAWISSTRARSLLSIIAVSDNSHLVQNHLVDELSPRRGGFSPRRGTNLAEEIHHAELGQKNLAEEGQEISPSKNTSRRGSSARKQFTSIFISTHL